MTLHGLLLSSFCLYNLICFIQGIPGDEGLYGEPGMTGDPVSKFKHNTNLYYYMMIIGPTWYQGTERKYQRTLEGMVVC